MTSRGLEQPLVDRRAPPCPSRCAGPKIRSIPRKLSPYIHIEGHDGARRRVSAEPQLGSDRTPLPTSKVHACPLRAPLNGYSWSFLSSSVVEQRA